MAQKDMVTITAVQLENLLRHDTNALAQVKALQDTGLAKTYGVEKGDILRLIQKAERESTNEEITAVDGPVVNMRLAAASVLASRESTRTPGQGSRPVGQRS